LAEGAGLRGMNPLQAGRRKRTNNCLLKDQPEDVVVTFK